MCDLSEIVCQAKFPLILLWLTGVLLRAVLEFIDAGTRISWLVLVFAAALAVWSLVNYMIQVSFTGSIWFVCVTLIEANLVFWAVDRGGCCKAVFLDGDVWRSHLALVVILLQFRIPHSRS